MKSGILDNKPGKKKKGADRQTETDRLRGTIGNI